MRTNKRWCRDCGKSSSIESHKCENCGTAAAYTGRVSNNEYNNIPEVLKLKMEDNPEKRFSKLNFKNGLKSRSITKVLFHVILGTFSGFISSICLSIVFCMLLGKLVAVEIPELNIFYSWSLARISIQIITSIGFVIGLIFPKYILPCINSLAIGGFSLGLGTAGLVAGPFIGIFMRLTAYLFLQSSNGPNLNNTNFDIRIGCLVGIIIGLIAGIKWFCDSAVQGTH